MRINVENSVLRYIDSHVAWRFGVVGGCIGHEALCGPRRERGDDPGRPDLRRHDGLQIATIARPLLHPGAP